MTDDTTDDSEGPVPSIKFPFVGIPSFLRADIHTDLDTLDAAIAVLGVPTDEGSPFMGGSDRVWFDNVKICLN